MENSACAKYGCYAPVRGHTIYCDEHHEPWCEALKISMPEPDECDCHQPHTSEPA